MGLKQDYIEAVWNLMIAYGGVFENLTPEMFDAAHTLDRESYRDRWDFEKGLISYYGAGIEQISKTKTEDVILRLIDGIEIDYAASFDPAEHIGYGFDGTFASHQLTVKILYGKLVLNDGTQSVWGTHIDEDFGFGNLVQMLTRIPSSLDEAVQRCADRLNNQFFTYSCKVG